MSADMQDLMAKLQMQLASQNQPSFAGIAAPVDPAVQQGLLSQLQNQAAVDNTGNGGGQYGFLLNAGKKDFQRAANSLGQAAQQGANVINGGAPTAPGSAQAMAAKQAILQARAQQNQDLANGVDPITAQANGLKILAGAGIDVSDALAKNQEAAQKNTTSAAGAKKDLAQADNYANQDARETAKDSREAAQNTWTTIGQGSGYIIQKNALGEVKSVKNQDATSAQQAAVTPQGMQSILDYYDLHDSLPANLPKGVAGNAWSAIGARRAAMGDTEGAAAASRAGLKSNTDALAQTQKQLSATTSYIGTMDKNITKAQELAKQLDFGDVKKLNGAYQSWLSGTSDPKYAQYNLFFSSVASEFAKIKSGSLGNAPVSDTQMHQALEDLNKQAGGLAPDALFSAVRTEGQNRLSSLTDERDSLLGRIKGGASRSSQPQQAAAGPTLTYDPASGTFK